MKNFQYYYDFGFRRFSICLVDLFLTYNFWFSLISCNILMIAQFTPTRNCSEGAGTFLYEFFKKTMFLKPDEHSTIYFMNPLIIIIAYNLPDMSTTDVFRAGRSFVLGNWSRRHTVFTIISHNEWSGWLLFFQ